MLSFDLNDGPDILRVLKDLNRKANCVLCTFHFADCYIKCFLIKLYCLFLYGCCIWSLDSKLLNSLQIGLNKVMRKVWNLPSQSHVSIVFSVSGVSSLYRIIYNRFKKFYKSGLESKSNFVSQIFNESSSFAYTFIGYNLRFGHTHLKNENISDRFMQISRIVRSIRRVFGVISPFEDLLVNLSCS